MKTTNRALPAFVANLLRETSVIDTAQIKSSVYWEERHAPGFNAHRAKQEDRAMVEFLGRKALSCAERHTEALNNCYTASIDHYALARVVICSPAELEVLLTRAYAGGK